MRIAVEASNLQRGGGVTHLREVLGHLDPAELGIERVAVWASPTTLAQLAERPWLEKRTAPALARGAVARFFWQWQRFSAEARAFGAQVVFAPGSTFLGGFRPFVTISQSLLPFDPAEIARYSRATARSRLRLLAALQARTFRRSAGVIFLSEAGRSLVESRVAGLPPRRAIVPHGLAPRFLCAPRPARPPAAFTAEAPARLLYVSHLSPYKHQSLVVAAARRLCDAGIPVSLDLVGPTGAPEAQRELERAMARMDPRCEFVRWRGEIAYAEMERAYADADLFVFASTCESFGLIVLEAMAAGLPVVCAGCSAPPEVLGPAGAYFVPMDADSLTATLARLLRDPAERERLAGAAYARAQTFDWQRCARETFGFVCSAAVS